jgi:hypothetical protein
LKENSILISFKCKTGYQAGRVDDTLLSAATNHRMASKCQCNGHIDTMTTPKNPNIVFMTGADSWSENTMKNTIDDADYIVNSRSFIIIYQYVMNSSYSHSIVAGGLLDIS